MNKLYGAWVLVAKIESVYYTQCRAAENAGKIKVYGPFEKALKLKQLPVSVCE